MDFLKLKELNKMSYKLTIQGGIMNNLITKMLTLCLCMNVVVFASNELASNGSEAKIPHPNQEKINDYIDRGLGRV